MKLIASASFNMTKTFVVGTPEPFLLIGSPDLAIHVERVRMNCRMHVEYIDFGGDKGKIVMQREFSEVNGLDEVITTGDRVTFVGRYSGRALRQQKYTPRGEFMFVVSFSGVER